MFFPCQNIKSGILYKESEMKKIKRKEKCEIPARRSGFCTIGREGRCPVTGSMTLETALVLPIFLSMMLAMMQFAKIMLVSSALLAGMQSTVKSMAAYTYIKELGVTTGDGVGAELLSGGISAVYARSQIKKESGFSSDLGSFSLMQSDLIHNNIIDLALSYYPNKNTALIPTPTVRTVLRTRVRAWTGRNGSGGTSEEETGQEAASEMVYVTTTGQVYHKDLECTHIKLSVKTINRSEIEECRNSSGGKYHACERCDTKGGNAVYITTYGDKYHGSLGCSGLKRNVLEVPMEEIEGWKACSKCG